MILAIQTKDPHHCPQLCERTYFMQLIKSSVYARPLSKVIVVVVSLAGQEKPSGLMLEREGVLVVVAEVVIEALDASTKVDKARIALIIIVPQKRIP